MNKTLIIYISISVFFISCGDSNSIHSVNNKIVNNHSNQQFSESDLIMKIEPTEIIQNGHLYSSDSSSKIILVSLFCWGFYEDENEQNKTMKFVTTPARLDPKDIIKSDKLICSIKSEIQLNLFNKLFSEYQIIDTIPGTDTRLIIEVRKSNGEIATLTYFNDSTLCYNNQFLYKYSVNVRSVIKQVFNLESISCNE